MTQEEITEGEILIALFDGMRRGEGKYPRGFTDESGSNAFSCWLNSEGEEITHIEYHTSFDWLMPACRKYCMLPEPKNKRTGKQMGNRKVFIRFAILDYLTGIAEIIDVFKALVEGIKWYNDNKEA